jgi:hypothetical protein
LVEEESFRDSDKGEDVYEGVNDVTEPDVKLAISAEV